METHRSRFDMILQPFEVAPFIRDLKADPDKYAYLQRVYKMCLSLNVGSEIVIDRICKPENIEFFIKCVCCFHSERRTGIQFSNDYTKVIKKQDFQYHGKTYY